MEKNEVMHFGATLSLEYLCTSCLREKVADLGIIIDLAMEDYKFNKVLDHCPACNTVRWYILVPNEVSQELSMFPGDESSIMVTDQEPTSDTISTILAYSNDLTLISGHITSTADRPRGFHLACRYLDTLLAPILGCIPDIDGYELAPLPGEPEDAAGRQLMVHARVLNDFTNLPACTTFTPHGPAREPCVTELVLPGAYEDLEPVVAQPKSMVGHHRKESEDSGVGLGPEIYDMGME